MSKNKATCARWTHPTEGELEIHALLSSDGTPLDLSAFNMYGPLKTDWFDALSKEQQNEVLAVVRADSAALPDLSSKNVHLYKGRRVRIVYPAPSGIRPMRQGLGVSADDLITLPVILREYDPTTHKVTFERPDGRLETIVPKEVLGAEG